jgi:ADP-ribose pyrophosphatase
MTYWKRIERQTLYHSDWLTVTLDKIELPDGIVFENFELMHYPHDSVGIVAVNNEGEILLVRAYRYLHESFDWEIPGGVVEADENHVKAARRELMEETGHIADVLTPLGSFYPHKATCDQKYFLYLAEGLEQKSPDIHMAEITESGFFSIEAVQKLIDDGEINDGLSLVALQRYFLKKRI